MNTQKISKQELDDQVYEFIRIKAQLKLLADKRAYLLEELEKVEKQCLIEESNFDRLLEK